MSAEGKSIKLRRPKFHGIRTEINILLSTDGFIIPKPAEREFRLQSGALLSVSESGEEFSCPFLFGRIEESFGLSLFDDDTSIHEDRPV